MSRIKPSIRLTSGKIVKIKQLKKEPPDQNEFDGMVNPSKALLFSVGSISLLALT